MGDGFSLFQERKMRICRYCFLRPRIGVSVELCICTPQRDTSKVRVHLVRMAKKLATYFR